MKNYIAKKLYKKMQKAGAKADVLNKVIMILESHKTDCAKEQITELYNMYCNKEDHHRRLLGIKDPDEMDNIEDGVFIPTMDSIAGYNRKREVEFVPATPEEYKTTIELPISELVKMGFSRIEKKPPVYPEDKIFLAFPHEWRNIIPANIDYPDFTGRVEKVSEEDLEEMPVIMGCLPIGIIRTPDGTESMPTFKLF